MENFDPFIEWLKAKNSDLPEFSETALSELYIEFTEELSVIHFEKLKNEMPSIIDKNKADNESFIGAHIFYWGAALNLLELLIDTCITAGSKINTERELTGEDKEDAHVDVIIRLHAKACAISNEILLLLKSGFADAAHARWRALHEINVTLLFLNLYGSECTERFLAHEIYDCFYGMKFHKKVESRLQQKSPSNEEYQRIELDFKKCIAKYGQEFDSQYGWAVPYVENSNPKRVGFQSLEKAVKLDHIRPYFKWASQNIHTSIRTLTNSLSVPSFDSNTINVGPSNFGLADPAHALALSLMQSTCGILNILPTNENVITMHCLKKLCDEIGDAFLKVNQKITA